MPIESNLAGVVRVAYEAVTGDFNRDSDVAARNYVENNKHMSDSALKLEAAQDRLRREVARGPAASRAQQRALLAVRQAEREVAAEATRATGALDRQNRELNETRTRATAAHGALRGLRGGIALATGGLLGTTGLVFGLRAVVGAADEAEGAEGRLAIAYRNAGVELDRSTDGVERALAARSRLSAFDDEDLSDALAKVIVRTKDHREALRGLADITDIARGRQISLEAATQLWIKASLNQAGQLRRVGIEVGKNTTAEQLLAKLRETYAGQAVRYATSEAAARDRANISLENASEIIGRALTPAIADAASTFADWIDRQNESGELQAKVNAAVEAGGKVVRGFAGALRIVKTVADPVVDALGGIERAAQLALIVGIVAKVRRAAGSFLPLQAASASTATRGVRDAGVFARAWDAATRNRTMVVTTTYAGGGVPTGGPTTGVPTTTAPTQRPTTRGRTVRERIGQYGLPLAGGAGTALTLGGGVLGGLILGSLAIGQQGEQTQGSLAYDPGRDRFVFVGPDGTRGGDVSDAYARRYDAQLYARAQAIRRRSRNTPASTGQPAGVGDLDRPNMGRAIDRPGRGGAGGRGGSRPRRTMGDISLDLARALTTGGTGDEERLYAEQIARYKAQIAVFEGRKNLTKTQRATLERLYGELGSAQASLDSIEDAREAELDRKSDARKAAAAKRRKAAADRRAKALERQRDFDRTAGAQREQAAKSDQFKRYGWGAAGAAAKKGPMRNTPTERDPNSITRDELGGILREFLTGWTSMVESYYPNIAGGSVSSNAVLEHLMREQTSVLRDGFTRPRVGFNRQLDESVMLS